MSDFEPNADGATAVADAPPEPSPDPTAPPEASVDAVPDDPQQAPPDPQDPAQTHDDAKVRRAMALLTQTRANAGKGPPPPNAPDGSPDRVQAALDLIHRTKAEKSAKKASGNPAQRLSELTASAQARGAEGAAATKAGQDVAFYSHDPADIAKRILQLHTQFGGDPEKTSNALRKEGWDGSLITPKLIADTKGQIQQITQQMQQMVQRAQEAQQMAENPPEQPEGQDGSAGQQPPPMPPDPQQMAAVLSVGQSKVQALQALQAQLEKEWGGDNLKFSQGPAPISTEPTKGPGLLDQLGSFLNSAASSYERIGGQGTGAGAPQKPSAPDYPKDMGGLQPTPDPGMLANLGRGLAHGAVKEGPSAITGGPEAARRMPEGQGVAGFVGETVGGQASGLFNPKNLAVNFLGYLTGLKAVEATAPVLGKVATVAGPWMAGVLEHMIGGAAGTAPLSMIEKAQSIDPERWISDPLGVLKEIGQAGAIGGALGAGIGAVSGTVTRAVHDPSPAARMAGAVIGSDKPASEIVKATENHLIENGGLPAESRAGGAQVGAIYEAATQALDAPIQTIPTPQQYEAMTPEQRASAPTITVGELLGHSSDHQQARTALAAIAEAEVAKSGSPQIDGAKSSLDSSPPETKSTVPMESGNESQTGVPAEPSQTPADKTLPVSSDFPVENGPTSGSPVPGTSPSAESMPKPDGAADQTVLNPPANTEEPGAVAEHIAREMTARGWAAKTEHAASGSAYVRIEEPGGDRYSIRVSDHANTTTNPDNPHIGDQHDFNLIVRDGKVVGWDKFAEGWKNITADEWRRGYGNPNLTPDDLYQPEAKAFQAAFDKEKASEGVADNRGRVTDPILEWGASDDSTNGLPTSGPSIPALPDRIAASFLDWVKQHDPESLTRMEAVKNGQTPNQIGPEAQAAESGGLRDPSEIRPVADGANEPGKTAPVGAGVEDVVSGQGSPAGDQPGDVGGVKKPVAKMTAAELRSELEAGPNEIVNLNSAPRASLMKAVKYLRDEAAGSDRPLQAMGAASRFDPEIVAAATDRARTLAVHGSEATQPPGKFAESLRQLWSGAKEQAAYFLQQTGAPFLRTIAPDSADALVKVGAARERVQAHSAELTGKVLDGAKPDDPNVKLAGIVLDEDNARGTVDAYIQQAAELDRAASKASMAGNAEEANHLGTESQKILAKAQEVKSHVGEGGTFPTEEEYQAAAAKPEVQAIIDRYRDNVNPYTEELYKTAKRLDPATELPSRGRQFGVRINRLAMNLGDESSGTTVGVGGVPSGLARGRLRGAKFDVRATGTGEAYNTSIPDMIGASVGGNMERAALHQTYDQLVKDGVAEYSDSPKSILIDGIPTRAEEIRTDPRKEPAKWIQIREDAWRDVNRVLARGEPTNIPGFTAASKTTTGSAIVGVAEPVAHIFNLLGAAALRPYRSAGGLGMIAEGLARSPIPGGKFVANVSALIPKLIDVIHNDPVAAEGWSQLADVGTARAESANSGLVGTALAKFDKAVRLVLNDTFDHLVERGEAVDSPGNRAEFTSLPGNYSRRLSGDIVRVLKDTGVNPFATQKKAAIVQAKDALTLNPGYEATTTAKAVLARLEQALPTILAPVVGTVIANYAINGTPWGRPGTTFGAIDTGKDDENGKIIQSDLLWKSSGLRRVAGVTGATDFAAKIRAGEGAGDATNAAMRQAGNNLLEFLAGPAMNFASETVAGQRIGFGLPRTSPVVPEGPGLKQGLVNAGYAASQLNKTATKIAASGVRLASPDAADAMVRATGDQDGSVLGDLSKIALPSGRDSSRANDQAQIDHAVKINKYVEDLSSRARRQPIDKRADFINAEITSQSEADQAAIWSKLKRSGVLSHP